MKAEHLDGALFASDYVPRGNPVVETAQYDPKQTGRRVMRASIQSRFEAWYGKWYLSPQAPNEIRLPMPHPKQKSVIYSTKRFKVMVCGRRFGKTTSALIKAVTLATSKPHQVIYYIAPTYRQAKQIAWGMLLNWVGQAYLRKNEQDLVLEFHNGSKIYLKGAENPDALRGSSVHLAILDEYQDIRPKVWEQIIRPMILDTRGEVWFIGTPKGFNHFHDLFTKVASGALGPDWIAFRLTSYDNPHMPRAEIEAAKAESDPRSFAQEYMAEFIQFEGLVYPDFTRQSHLQEFDLSKIQGIDLCGIDFGADHPTAGIFARVTPAGDVYVWGEHYRRDASADDHATDLKAVRGRHAVRRWYLDPSAKQFAKELRRNGIICTPAVNNREFGISELRALLRAGRLHVHPNCSNLVFEFEHHRYKSDRDLKTSEGDVSQNVKKTDDDALDALRYLVASYFKGKHSKGDPVAEPPREIPTSGNIEFDLVNLDNNGPGRYNDSRDPGANIPVASEFQALL